MPWSTRELAELANTTVNTIRHYHRIGLLEEPKRRYNGYKQYEVLHLVRLLRIRRLADLGVPLSHMHDLGNDESAAPIILHDLDDELQATIERLQQARSDIAAILRFQAPVDSPAGFESASARLTDRDTSMIHIYTQLYDEEALADVQRMAAEPDDTSAEIDRLPADADEGTRQMLADRLAEILARNFVDYPWLSDPASHLSKGAVVTAETFVQAMAELYNPAQLDVLVRANAIAGERARGMREQRGPED